MRTNMLHSNLLGRLGNGLLKFVVLVMLTTCVGNVFGATTTISSNINDNKTHTYVNKDGITIDKTPSLSNLYSSTVQISGSTTFVVITGNVTIAKNRTLEVTDGATLIIEGDLTIGNKATLEINGNGVVIVKNKIKAASNNNDIDLLHLFGSSYLICYEGFEGNNIHFTEYLLGGTYQDEDEQYIYGYAPYNKETSPALKKAQEIMEYARSQNLLPIELTSFTVSATEYGYTFNWVTASEVENDYFTLEYSIDGVDFNEIDYVHGAGTTSETSEYTYRWDEAPEFDVVYFRLKQTDYNGEYSYSDVIVASRKKSSGANGTFRYGPLNLQIQDGELRYIVK